MLQSDHFGDDLRAAVEAIKRGETDRARRLIDHILMGDPQNADAWYLESFIADSVEARVRALGRALAANPMHEGAHRRLHSLQQPAAPAGSSPTANDAEIARREAEAVKALSLDDLLHGNASNTFVVEDAPPASDMPKRGSSNEAVPNTAEKRKRSSSTPRWGVLLAILAVVTIGTPFVVVAANSMRGDDPTPPPITNTPLPPPPLPTPTALYSGWNWDQPLVLRGEVNGYPAGTQVWLVSMWFTGSGWVYEVGLDYSPRNPAMNLHQEQLAYPGDVPPPGTPTPSFPTYTAGTDLITIQQVGEIPANTLVQVLRARFDGNQWVYNIITAAGNVVAEAPESALGFPP